MQRQLSRDEFRFPLIVASLYKNKKILELTTGMIIWSLLTAMLVMSKLWFTLQEEHSNMTSRFMESQKVFDICAPSFNCLCLCLLCAYL